VTVARNHLQLKKENVLKVKELRNMTYAKTVGEKSEL
jgi:hypothetical protein